MTSSGAPLRITVMVLIATAACFAIGALVFNELVLAQLASDNTLQAPMIIRIRRTQSLYLLAGAVLGLAAFLISRLPAARRVMDRPAAPRIVLALLVLGAPIVAAELALRCFFQGPSKTGEATRIFIADDDLGWRLNPGARDFWGDVPVCINERGLRGPALPYERTGRALRILWLGDSVTFGFRLPRYQMTFPHLAAVALEDRLGSKVESVNAGVGGYSPWQHLRFLENEGLRYRPDLVVVSFVLNDVTEKFFLTRFGGAGISHQLSMSVSHWTAGDKSAIVHYLRKASGRLRFGEDVQAGAVQKEVLDVESLVHEPDRPGTAEAWQLTLDNLDAIFSLCGRENIEAALVIFPFTFQLEDPEHLSGPQEKLLEFAAENDIPALDLLPILAARLKADGSTIEDFFIDKDHPTADGNEVIGRSISDFLIDNGLLALDPLNRPPHTDAFSEEPDGKILDS